MKVKKGGGWGESGEVGRGGGRVGGGVLSDKKGVEPLSDKKGGGGTLRQERGWGHAPTRRGVGALAMRNVGHLSP